MKVNKKQVLYFIIVASNFSLLSCSHINNRKLETATSEFHTQFKERKFDDIYIQSSPMLKSMVAKEDLTKNLENTLSYIGEIVEIEKENVPPPIQDNTEYNRQFSVFLLRGTKGECVEFFTWDASYEVAKLVLYHSDCKNASLSKR